MRVTPFSSLPGRCRPLAAAMRGPACLVVLAAAPLMVCPGGRDAPAALPGIACAAQPPDDDYAVIEHIAGEGWLWGSGEGRRALVPGMAVWPEDVLVTGAEAWVALQAAGGRRIVLPSNERVRIGSIGRQGIRLEPLGSGGPAPPGRRGGPAGEREGFRGSSLAVHG